MSIVVKAIGWLLLLLGLAVIAYGIYSSYQIFTARSAVPVLFSAAAPAQPSSGSVLGLPIEQMLGSQLQQLLPTNALPQILNLLSWSIFAMILIFAGSQIAGLGIKMIL